MSGAISLPGEGVSLSPAAAGAVGPTGPAGPTGATGATGATGTAPSTWLWGDGSDGDVTISSPVTLTKDMFYNNLTLAVGAAISTAKFRIFVAGTLDLSNAPSGAILGNPPVDGGAGGNGLVGTGGAGGTSDSNAGAAGGTTDGSDAAPGFGGAGNGGAALKAGNGGITAAHNTVHTGGSALGGANYLGFQWPADGLGVFTLSDGTTTTQNGASGGPGGGGGNGNVNGGGGGGGGGCPDGFAAIPIKIAARVIARGANANAGIISVKGGKGGDGGNGFSGGIGGGGGGGSGAGGSWVFIGVGSLTGSTIPNAIDVSGGAGGKGGNGFGAGSTGGDGGASGGSGTVAINNTGAGTLTLTATIAGALGSAASGLTGGAGAPANTKRVAL